MLIILGTIFKPTLWLLILILSFLSWLVPARLVRGETPGAAHPGVRAGGTMAGAKRSYLLYRHIVPNAIGIIAVFATFQVADSILVFAALGFIGLGIPAGRVLGRHALGRAERLRTGTGGRSTRLACHRAGVSPSTSSATR